MRGRAGAARRQSIRRADLARLFARRRLPPLRAALNGGRSVASFRFVHTADIHLDSPLKGLAGYDPAAAERVRTAGREAFDNLVAMAIDEGAAFVVIAGDLYDGDWRDYQTGLFFVSQMGRLARAGVRAFVVYGNHDAESQITRRLQLPDNVRVFSARKPESVELGEFNAVLHGQSFGQRDMSVNMALAYPPPRGGAFNIGVLHTGLGGQAGPGAGAHPNYAPCALEDLTNKGYDYWALGHVHKRGVLRERPHVVFPGNIQGRHIRETGAKGAYLVTVEDGEVSGLEFSATDVVRWALVPVAAGGCARLSEAMDLMRDAIAQAVQTQAEGRMLACRVEIRGRTEAHWALTASGETLLAEARAAALAAGGGFAWVERVDVATGPVLNAAAMEAREDALGTLQRMLGEAADDPELTRRLDDEIGVLIRKLPHEARDDPDDPLLGSAVRGDYAALIERVGGYLAARITAAE
jgi:exonuclease SbcD